MGVGISQQGCHVDLDDDERVVDETLSHQESGIRTYLVIDLDEFLLGDKDFPLYLIEIYILHSLADLFRDEVFLFEYFPAECGPLQIIGSEHVFSIDILQNVPHEEKIQILLDI